MVCLSEGSSPPPPRRRKMPKCRMRDRYSSSPSADTPRNTPFQKSAPLGTTRICSSIPTSRHRWLESLCLLLSLVYLDQYVCTADASKRLRVPRRVRELRERAPPAGGHIRQQVQQIGKNRQRGDLVGRRPAERPFGRLRHGSGGPPPRKKEQRP